MTTKVSSYYGPRELFGRNFHSGIDYATPVGTPIYINKELRVTFAGTQNGYGNVVYAVDSLGVEHRFGHLDSIPAETKPGAVLSPGTKIANTGNTGDSTGPHLHYEIRRRENGKLVSADPLTTIDPSTGKNYDHTATFEKGKPSMRNSTSKPEPGYTRQSPDKPKVEPKDTPKSRGLSRPQDNQSAAESNRLGKNAQKQSTAIRPPRINPLLKID